jgi:hypothetical protein
MGAWGAGLYSGDFAMDLRSTIGAVARLPFNDDRLVEILCQAQTGAANNSDHEEHTVFWLIVADQFAKRAIACARARQKALAIIDGGSDLALHAKLGMSQADLRKRRKTLEELRSRLTIAATDGTRPRPMLKKPQSFLMEVGDCYVYPTSGRQCINSYYPSKDKIPNWSHDGWGAMVVVDRGRAFDFLTWYTPLIISAATREKPGFAALRAIESWVLKGSGTCSAVHFKRLELEKVGALAVDRVKLARAFRSIKPGTYAAINDISICNALSFPLPGSVVPVARAEKGKSIYWRPFVLLPRLDDILSN